MTRITRFLVAAILLFAVISGSAWCAEAKKVTVAGRVLLPDSSSAAGAVVTLVDPKNGGETAAGPDGRFTLSVVPGQNGFWAQLGAMALPFTHYVNVDKSGKPDQPLDFRLEPGAVVMGRVTDKSTGKPVAGARVLIRDLISVETNADGIYRFEALPKSGNTIGVMKEGFSSSIIKFSAAGQSFVQVDIDIVPEGVVKGMVTDEKGKPIAGALVGPNLRYFDFQYVRTDNSGHYALGRLDPSETAMVGAQADGYECITTDPVIFPPGKREAVKDFNLISTKVNVRTITGRVTDQEGKPIKGVRVAYGWTDCYAGYKTTRTDEGGQYASEGRRPDPEHCCRRSGRVRTSVQIRQVKGEPPSGSGNGAWALTGRHVYRSRWQAAPRGVGQP